MVILLDCGRKSEYILDAKQVNSPKLRPSPCFNAADSSGWIGSPTKHWGQGKLPSVTFSFVLDQNAILIRLSWYWLNEVLLLLWSILNIMTAISLVTKASSNKINVLSVDTQHCLPFTRMKTGGQGRDSKLTYKERTLWSWHPRYCWCEKTHPSLSAQHINLATKTTCSYLLRTSASAGRNKRSSSLKQKREFWTFLLHR